jgi:hypothetical protein
MLTVPPLALVASKALIVNAVTDTSLLVVL